MRTNLCATLLVLLPGCATTSVTTLLKASKQSDAIAPSMTVVRNELKGRSFEVGTICFDVREAEEKQGPDIPDNSGSIAREANGSFAQVERPDYDNFNGWSGSRGVIDPPSR